MADKFSLNIFDLMLSENVECVVVFESKGA